MHFNARIDNVYNAGNSLKALATVTVCNCFTIHKIMVGSRDGSLSVAMPFEKYVDANGITVYRDIVHPVSAEARREIEKAVLAAYCERTGEAAPA